MKKLFCLLAALFLTACAHSLQLVEFETGQVLNGEYNELNRTVTVTMPDGEVLTGKYSALTNAAVTFGSAFGSGTAFSGNTSATAFGSSFGYGISAGGQSSAYALLKSEKSNLMMEILVKYSEWSGHGFGEARTNDGRRYKVQF